MVDDLCSSIVTVSESCKLLLSRSGYGHKFVNAAGSPSPCSRKAV